MIILHGFGTGFGLPGIGLPSTKTRIRLKMPCGTRHRTRPTGPKRPRRFIDDGLGALQRMLVWVLERMIEHYVHWTVAGASFVNPENFVGASPLDSRH